MRLCVLSGLTWCDCADNGRQKCERVGDRCSPPTAGTLEVVWPPGAVVSGALSCRQVWFHLLSLAGRCPAPLESSLSVVVLLAPHCPAGGVSLRNWGWNPLWPALGPLTWHAVPFKPTCYHKFSGPQTLCLWRFHRCLQESRKCCGRSRSGSPPAVPAIQRSCG